MRQQVVAWRCSSSAGAARCQPAKPHGRATLPSTGGSPNAAGAKPPIGPLTMDNFVHNIRDLGEPTSPLWQGVQKMKPSAGARSEHRDLLRAPHGPHAADPVITPLTGALAVLSVVAALGCAAEEEAEPSGSSGRIKQVFAGDTCSAATTCMIPGVGDRDGCYSAGGQAKGICTVSCSSDADCKLANHQPAICVQFKSSGLCLWPCTTACQSGSGQTCQKTADGRKACWLP